uniref:Uncharacterized protein n=1 Tax=Lygus hesperus TaxID=30085 RepID=A0A0A9ZEL8_LYGHE
MVPAPNYWYPGLGKSSLTQSSASHFRAVGVVQLYQDPSGSSSETEEDIPEKSSGDKVLVTPKPGSDEYNSHQSSEQPGNPVVIPPKTDSSAPSSEEDSFTIERSGEYGKQPSNVKPNDPKKSTKSSEQHAPKTKVDSGDVSNEEVLQNKLRHLS